jgi:MFS family permease
MHRRHEDPAVDRKIRNSLRLSILDGAAFSVMIGMAESYFQAFAVFLKATVFQVGIVYTVPMFLASSVQLFSTVMLRWVRSRKRVAVVSGLVRSLLFVPLVFVSFLGPYRVWVLLAVISAYFSLNYLPNPAWTSWMRDLVDENSRGVFFSRRNRLANLLALLGIVVAGLVLHAFERTEVVGFMIIFAVAALGSVGSTVSLSLKYDLPYQEPHGVRKEFLRLTGELAHSNFGRFVLYNVLLHFGVFFAGPFFVPYMLNDLGLSYLQFMINTSLVVLVKFVALPLWGEFGDRYGNRKILILANIMIACLPFLWMASRSFWWVCLVQALGGLSWAGFDIAALNFPYDVLPPARVARNTSFLIFYKGVAILAGGLTGGYFLRHFSLFGSQYYGNFFLSGLIRLLLALPVLFLLREERKVEHISYHNLMFKLVSVGPRRGLQLLALGRTRDENKEQADV